MRIVALEIAEHFTCTLEQPRILGLLEDGDGLSPEIKRSRAISPGRVQLGEVQESHSLFASIAALPERSEALLEHRLCLAEASHVPEKSAEVVKDHGFIVPVIEASPDGQALLKVRFGLIVMTLPVMNLPQSAQDFALIVSIADRAADLQCLPVDRRCLLMAAVEPVDIAQIRKSLGLAEGVANFPQQLERLLAEYG